MLGPVALTGRTPRRRGRREGQGEEWARRHLSDRQPNGKKAREQTKRSCRSKKPLDWKSPIQGRTSAKPVFRRTPPTRVVRPGGIRSAIPPFCNGPPEVNPFFALSARRFALLSGVGAKAAT